MSQALVQRGYHQAKKLLLIQTLITAVVATLGLIKDFQIAIALLSGGGAVVLSNICFVVLAFSKSGAQRNKQVVRAFYLGETLKIVLSAALIVVAFIMIPGFEIYALVGFIVALLAQWLAPLIIKAS